ncbi:START domain-containing protein [Alteromonadaceae bacterium BrNp21-10]|nr:START domain-containing protein [Alteromonadaceae bacterium BrNp21-10]
MQSLIYMSLILLSFFCRTGNAQEWQQQSDRQQVQIYSQQTANGIIKIKATTRLTSRIGALINLLHDTQRSQQWIDNIQKVEVLDRPAPNEAIVHSYFNGPFIISDRDMVTHSQINQDPQSLQVRIDIGDLGGEYVPINGYVRMKNVQGMWLISPLGNGIIEIEYQGSADPAGNIPTWLANSTLLSSTERTFVQLRSLLVQPQYQLAAPNFIEETQMANTTDSHF